MSFLLQINDINTKIPIKGISEQVNTKPENESSNSFQIIYSIDFNVLNGINYQNIMTLVEGFFEPNTISSFKIYDSTETDILYQTTRYKKLEAEYLYLDENGEQSFTIHAEDIVD